MIASAALFAGGLGGLILLALIVGLYLLPTLVGWQRGAPDLGMVAVLNVLLGWTFIGWVVALALAFRSRPPAASAPLRRVG